MTVSYSAELVTSVGLSAADTVENTVDISSYFGRPETERLANPTFDYRTYTGPDDSVSVDLFLPAASLTKTAVGPDPARVGTPYEWSIVITNTDTVASIASLDLTDTLPPNWDFDASSAAFTGGPVGDPTITSAPTGDVLAWSGLAGLAPGASATLTFTASPTAAAQVDPGLGVDHTNTAEASFTDASGASASADGPYETNSDTAAAQMAIGSLGDQVWFDADDNGLFDGVDIPLSGVTVDLVWAGPDGNLATTGDNVAYPSSVTDLDGLYSFTGLPEGTLGHRRSGVPSGRHDPELRPGRNHGVARWTVDRRTRVW